MAEDNSSVPGPSSSSAQSGLSLRLNLSRIGSIRLAPRLREDIHQVVRDLSPLVDGARPNVLSSLLRQASREEPGRVHVHRQAPAAPQPQQPEAAEPPAAQGQFVIDVDGVNEPQPHVHAEPVNPSGNNNNANNNNASGRVTTAADILRQSPETRAVLSVFEKYLPFVLILICKGIYDHRTGLLVFVGLLITFQHANTAVKREVSKQSKRNLSTLLIVAVNQIACIAFIYFFFDEEKLYSSLVFLPPATVPLTVWTLIWIVGVTDYILKLITILIKMVIIAMPSQILPFPRRGKYYLFIEQSSQLYRSLVPIHPWLYYLFEAYQTPSKIVGVILAAAYMMSKGSDLLRHAKAWRLSLLKLLQNVRYGCSPTTDQIASMGNQCPICHDSFQIPTMLNCKHIFCEECVTTWFDRERTCPMCRAQVVDDPVWRDGATTHFPQLF